MRWQPHTVLPPPAESSTADVVSAIAARFQATQAALDGGRYELAAVGGGAGVGDDLSMGQGGAAATQVV